MIKRYQNNKQCNEVTITIATFEPLNIIDSPTQTKIISIITLLKKIQ